MKRTMMWRTTMALGDFGVGIVLVYLAFLVADDSLRTVAFRIVTATLLSVAAYVLLLAGLHELRGSGGGVIRRSIRGGDRQQLRADKGST
jgi:hypothetical protein